jgi:ParB family transcriptional regulator, chromosome partitioning protein
MQAEFQIIPINKIVESATNPRRHFSEQGLLDLTDSVRKHGVLVPLLVRPVNGHYEIIAGARRFRAAKATELRELPARVKEIGDDEALELQILENLIREDVHPLEEALGYQALLKRPGYDIPSIAAKVAKSESYIYQRMKLIDLIKPAQDAFLKDEITAGHALLIARLQSSEQEKALEACYDRYVRKGDDPVVVGVRQLAAWIHQNVHLDLHAAPFSKTATDLGISTPCINCEKRTGFMPQLFPDIARKDTCTYPKCYEMKLEAHVAKRKQESEAKGQKLIEVSSNYPEYGRKAKASDPIFADQYKEVSKKDRCASAQKAIVVEGRHDIGKEMFVCSDKKCKVHHGSGGSSYRRSPKEIAKEKEAGRQRKIEGVIRGAVVDKILQKVRSASDLSRNSKYILAESFIREMDRDSVRLVLSRHNWETTKSKAEQYVDFREILKSKVNDLEVHDLHAFLIELAMASHMFINTWSTLERPQEFLDTAKEYGIDIKAIEDETTAAAVETVKPKKETEAGKLQSKTAKGKTKAAKQ